MDKPPFDPSQPFEAVKPPFDPSQPFTAAPASNSLAGSAKAIGSGLYNAAIAGYGLPGDVQALVHQGVDKAVHTVAPGLPHLEGGFRLPTSGDIKGAIESQTGPLDYKPQTSLEGYEKTGAEFLPGLVGPGGPVRKLAQWAIPALLSETAGQATEGTAAEPYARTGSAILGSIAAHKATVPPTPPAAKITPSQVLAASSAGYKNPSIDAVTFKGTAIPDLADDIVSTLNRDKRNARLVPDIHTIVDEMKNPINGQTHTIEDLETTRRLLGEKAQDFTDKTKQAAAVIAIKKIDKYLASNPQSDVLTGNIKTANDALVEARSNKAIGETAQRIQDKIRAGEVGAGSTHSGMNVENQLRQKLRPVLTSKKQAQNLTDENLADVEDLVMGSNTGNALRKVGNVLGGGGGIGTAVISHIGNTLGGAAGAVVAPAFGYGMRSLGNARARSEAAKIVQGILARSPEGQQWQAIQKRIARANPTPSRLPGGLLSALLSLQQSDQGRGLLGMPSRSQQ